MADRAMPKLAPDERGRVERIELCACTRSIREIEPRRDAVATALHALARLPWRQRISFMPLETVTWGSPFLPDSEMSAFFFAVPPADEDRVLTQTAEADVVLQVMPITREEREFATREGSLALVDRFEVAGVPPLVDWDRPSCVTRAP